MISNIVQNVVNGGDGNAQSGDSASASSCTNYVGNSGCGGSGGGAMWILMNGQSAVQVNTRMNIDVVVSLATEYS